MSKYWSTNMWFVALMKYYESLSTLNQVQIKASPLNPLERLVVKELKRRQTYDLTIQFFRTGTSEESFLFQHATLCPPGFEWSKPHPSPQILKRSLWSDVWSLMTLQQFLTPLQKQMEINRLQHFFNASKMQ
jgi:hypothetical protein